MNYSVMIKPASGRCNIRCKYCFYIDECVSREQYSMGLMREDDAGKLVNRVLGQLTDKDSMNFAFQGGEPTLAGLAYFKAFVKAANAHDFGGVVSFALQTNGFIIDDEWAEFLHENNFLVGLSMDGPQIYHDANRRTPKNEGTFERILNTKKLFDKHKVEYNILTVLTEQAARRPREYWNFILKNKIKFIQFVPCLGELDGGDSGGCAVTSKKFASFYTEIFPLWAKELQKGNYISIKFFDDFFNLMLRRTCTACGFTGRCNVQMIVEADGSVYPCDFYVLDNWKLGNIYEKTIHELQTCDLSKEYLLQPRTNGEICQKCRYRNMCGGGCPRMKYSMYLNKAEDFCGYKQFLDNCHDDIDKMARHLAQFQQ